MSLAKRLRDDLAGAADNAERLAGNIEKAATNADQFAGSAGRANAASGATTERGTWTGQGHGGGVGQLLAYDRPTPSASGGSYSGGIQKAGGNLDDAARITLGQMGLPVTEWTIKAAIQIFTGIAPGYPFTPEGIMALAAVLQAAVATGGGERTLGSGGGGGGGGGIQAIKPPSYGLGGGPLVGGPGPYLQQPPPNSGGGGGGGGNPGGPGFRAVDTSGIERRLDALLVAVKQSALGVSPHTARRAGR